MVSALLKNALPVIIALPRLTIKFTKAKSTSVTLVLTTLGPKRSTNTIVWIVMLASTVIQLVSPILLDLIALLVTTAPREQFNPENVPLVPIRLKSAQLKKMLVKAVLSVTTALRVQESQLLVKMVSSVHSDLQR
jgi:hypothetical protein